MKNEQYQSLIGKNRKEILEELGEKFNFYPAEVWTYKLNKNWIWQNIYLIIYFKDCKVEKIKIEKCYGKPNY